MPLAHLKEAAKWVESADDALVELRSITPGTPLQWAPADEEQGDPWLEARGFAPMSIDPMAPHTGLGAAKLAAQLSPLEIEGRIAALAGGWSQRVKSRVIE